MAKSIAPLLFEKTRRKKITVRQALTNNKWIDHIYPPTSQEEVRQFVRLWEELQGVVLNEAIQVDILLGDGLQMTSIPHKVLIRYSLWEFTTGLR